MKAMEWSAAAPPTEGNRSEAGELRFLTLTEIEVAVNVVSLRESGEERADREREREREGEL